MALVVSFFYGFCKSISFLSWFLVMVALDVSSLLFLHSHHEQFAQWRQFIKQLKQDTRIAQSSSNLISDKIT